MIQAIRRAWLWLLHWLRPRCFMVYCPVCQERLRFWKGQVAAWATDKKRGRWTCKSCHTDVTFLLAQHEFTAHAQRASAELRAIDPEKATERPEKPRAEVN